MLPLGALKSNDFDTLEKVNGGKLRKYGYNNNFCCGKSKFSQNGTPGMRSGFMP